MLRDDGVLLIVRSYLYKNHWFLALAQVPLISSVVISDA